MEDQGTTWYDQAFEQLSSPDDSFDGSDFGGNREDSNAGFDIGEIQHEAVEDDCDEASQYSSKLLYFLY